MRNIKRLASVIERNIFTTEATLSYGRVTEAFIRLANAIHAYEGESEELWCIELRHSSLDDLIVGAYWHYLAWHGGQGYAALCALDQVFNPGLSSEEEESKTYQALESMAA